MGIVINVIALVYGGVMLVNFGLWDWPGLFGNWGNSLRDLTNPNISTLTFLHSAPLTGLPAWPVFESVLGLIFLGGLAYYAVAERRVEREEIEADEATGEAIIG